jgi:hypothetical protein
MLVIVNKYIYLKILRRGGNWEGLTAYDLASPQVRTLLR